MDAKDRAAFVNSVDAAASQTPQTASQPEKTEKVAELMSDMEPASIFAEGLPEWNLEPPQLAVRRRHSL